MKAKVEPATLAKKSAPAPKVTPKKVAARKPAIKKEKASPAKSSVAVPVKRQLRAPAVAPSAVAANKAIKAVKKPRPQSTSPSPTKSTIWATVPVERKPAADTLAIEPAIPRGKLVRDSFTMPQQDFALISILKSRALEFRRPTKKSELLRAGLQVLAALRADDLKKALGNLAPLKTGRPKRTG